MRSTLVIEEKTVVDPPADGSSILWSLVSVQHEVFSEPGDTFGFAVDGGHGAMSVDDDDLGGEFQDGRLFDCDDTLYCEILASTEPDLWVEFAFADPVSDPIQLVALAMP